MSETKKTSPWVWISLALILALFVAFILFLDQNIVKSGRKENTMQQNTGVNTKPVFDFYTVLPERKIDIEETVNKQADIPNASAKSPRNKKQVTDRYIIQAGSFQRMQDADRRKAELAMLGLESSIKTAKVKGKTYYRVEMGPVSDSESSRIQRNLISNDLDFFAKSIP